MRTTDLEFEENERARQSACSARISGDLQPFGVRRPVIRRRIIQLFLVLVPLAGASVGAESASTDAAAQSEISAGNQFGFSSSRSVEGTLDETAEQQREGPLASFRARKARLEERTGLTYGFDNQLQYLASDSDKSPSDAMTNVTRFYGTWTATGRSTPDNGALVFKLEYRTAVGDYIPTQALGPWLGYAGTFASTYSDAGLILTNFYWRQRFAGGRGSFVIGQVDTYDYVNVNSLASPWNAFTNLAFEQQPTYPGPSQGLGPPCYGGSTTTGPCSAVSRTPTPTHPIHGTARKAFSIPARHSSILQSAGRPSGATVYMSCCS